MTSFAVGERNALCETFIESGPDAPTLCEGWRTRDLAAHLVVRETRPLAALGLVVPALAGRTRHAQDRMASTTWTRLVARVRYRPWWTPLSWGVLDEAANLLEMFVHHEDVLRARDSWMQPRILEPEYTEALWQAVARRGGALTRRIPVGVTLRHTDGREARIHRPPKRVSSGEGTSVVLVGDPGELVLYLHGRRDHARVRTDGSPEAVTALERAQLGV